MSADASLHEWTSRVGAKILVRTLRIDQHVSGWSIPLRAINKPGLVFAADPSPRERQAGLFEPRPRWWISGLLTRRNKHTANGCGHPSIRAPYVPIERAPWHVIWALTAGAKPCSYELAARRRIGRDWRRCWQVDVGQAEAEVSPRGGRPRRRRR